MRKWRVGGVWANREDYQASHRALWSRERERREVFLSFSCALVIELFSVALILAVSS